MVFALQAAGKGTSETVIGFIFGTFELTIFIAAPLFGNNVSGYCSGFFVVENQLINEYKSNDNYLKLFN